MRVSEQSAEEWADALSWESKHCPVGRWHRPEFVTTEQLTRDVYALAAKLPPDLAGIIGIARSGLLPASLLAMHLHLPLWILRPGPRDIIPAGNGWRLEGRPEGAGPLLVVDDTRMTGRSLQQANQVLHAVGLAARIRWAVVYSNPEVQQLPRLDYWARDLAGPHFLEWNLFNSVHLAQAAFDIDGILCNESDRDPAWQHGRPPLYPARRVPIKLVITGRSERHRESTLDWFNRWGMTVERLEMWPGTDAEREQPMAVSRFKARTFEDSGLWYFVESCPIQAREIAGLTGKPVICPAAKKVF